MTVVVVLQWVTVYPGLACRLCDMVHTAPGITLLIKVILLVAGLFDCPHSEIGKERERGKVYFLHRDRDQQRRRLADMPSDSGYAQ